MNNGSLLWVDDEIELLKAHIIYLEKKGYEVTTVSNGQDALDYCKSTSFDLILLDENMPGLSGLETLARIKVLAPSTPVVMVTKSEEENIMDQAIGSKIADYLIKPVNPTQILLTLKKNIHKKEIVSEVTQTSYQQEFGRIGMRINDSLTLDDWKQVYKDLVYWELALSEADSSMQEMLGMQKQEANQLFGRFIKQNYENWLTSDEHPVLSTDLFKTAVFPVLKQGEKVFLLVFDNLRFDQWKMIESEISDSFHVDEQLYCSILPTATQYARNALFSGLSPLQIARMYPDLWVDEEDEEGKNLNEKELIGAHLERYRIKKSFSYHKINESSALEKLNGQFRQLVNNDLNVVVLNFIDMLSHARTESRMVRELASNEAAYRSITTSWFKHSPVRELFHLLAGFDGTVVLTTDHGSIRVGNPTKVIGDRNTNTNLRYKLGKNLSYQARDVYEEKN